MTKPVRIGDAELYLGDCRDVLPTLGKVDAVVTDPPYGVGLQAKTTKHNVIKASTTYHDAPELVLPAIKFAADWWIANSSCAAITSGTRLLFDYPKPDSMGCIYSPNGAGRDRWGFGCFQPILYYGKCPYLAKGKGSRPNSFSSSHPGMHVTGENNTDHPCPKPLEWMLWLVNRVSMDGDTVLDPFMGSGTTGIACAKLGRRFIGIEVEERYFKIVCRRIEEAYRQADLFLAKPFPKPEQISFLAQAS